MREKELPDLDDDFASEASEFETLDELRNEIRSRIAAALEQRSEDDFRAATVDAAAAGATIDLPKELVHARAHDMWERLERSLSARGIDPAMYVQMQGKSREELVTDMEGEAQQALRREAVLEAVADAEEIEVSDDDLLEALGPGDGDEEPQKLLDNLREAGRDGLLRSEVRLRKAADVIAGSAKPIPAEQAAARDKLWTPEKEQAETETEKAEAGLWTPGSD